MEVPDQLDMSTFAGSTSVYMPPLAPYSTFIRGVTCRTLSLRAIHSSSVSPAIGPVLAPVFVVYVKPPDV